MIFYLNILCIGVGAFVGASLRYGIGRIFSKITDKFPLATLFVNIIGSFVLGFLSIFIIKIHPINPVLIHMLMVGFCGSLTTFSSFTFDTFYLFKSGKIKGFTNIILNVILSLLAFVLGMHIIQYL